MGCLRKLIQFLSTQAINLQMIYIFKIDPRLFQYVIQNPYHLGEDIDVVGIKELSCAEFQSLQHGGKSKDVQIMKIYKKESAQASWVDLHPKEER